MVLTYDIRKEPLIRRNWGFMMANRSTYPDGILITGANSFIGAHVVNILKTKWQGPVHLLIRAVTSGEAVQKMQNAFRKWQLGVFDTNRFSIHLGDVTLERMGLSLSEYSDVKRKTGFILHLAMNPLYNLPYAHFRRL